MKRFIVFLFFIFAVHTASFAENIQVIPQNQVKLEINGAVCAYCAYGVQKSLSKMDSIDKSKGHNGVETDIEKQTITLHLKDNAVINIDQAYHAIKKGGYEPRSFYLRVKGSVVEENGVTFLEDAQNKRLFKIGGDKLTQLSPQQEYELQVMINEEALLQLKQDKVPMAHIQTIF